MYRGMSGLCAPHTGRCTGACQGCVRLIQADAQGHVGAVCALHREMHRDAGTCTGMVTYCALACRWVAAIESSVNTIRNDWQNIGHYLSKDWVRTGKKQGPAKPSMAVRTRWLSLIDSSGWLVSNLEKLKSIIPMYKLKNKNGKKQKRWNRVWKIIKEPKIEQYAKFICTWGEVFFKPGLKWIEGGMTETVYDNQRDMVEKDLSTSGHRAQEMPNQVNVWKREVKEICEGYEEFFATTIAAMGGNADAKETCKHMVDEFGGKVLEMLDITFGQWQEAPLCLAEMLEPGQAHRVATNLVDKHGDDMPKGMSKHWWKALQAFVKQENGYTDMHQFNVHLPGGQVLDLETYTEAKFLSINIHNVDPERPA